MRSYWRQRPRRIAEARAAGTIGDGVVVSAIFVFRKAFRLACGRRAGGYGLLVRVRQTRKAANGTRLNFEAR